METRLTISTLPPSVNAMYARTKSGRVRRSPAYMSWLDAEGHFINRQKAGQPKWTTPVHVAIAMRRPNKLSDVDNRQKPILDLLQAHGVIANDRLVDVCRSAWSDVLPEGVAAEISISPAGAIRPDAIRGRAA